MAMNDKERVKPIFISDKETGDRYELDFSRDSIVFAESRKFDPDDIFKYPATKIPEFFFYAFRKNHRSIAREKTDKLLARMGGLTEQMLVRLAKLYEQARTSNNFQDEEDLAKNEFVSVEM